MNSKIYLRAFNTKSEIQQKVKEHPKGALIKNWN